MSSNQSPLPCTCEPPENLVEATACPCLDRLLVVGSGPAARATIADHFASRGRSVERCAPDAVADRLAFERFGLVIIDLDEPGADALPPIIAIREHSRVPIIVTARHCPREDYVAYFRAGADDILRKPFELDELVVRAHAILRRHAFGQMEAQPSLPRGFRFHGWELLQRTRTLRDPGGAVVDLTKGEYALLTAFLQAPGRELSRIDLIRATRTHEDLVDRSIDVQVMRLRRKLAREPLDPRLIATVRGRGYRFDADVEILF